MKNREERDAWLDEKDRRESAKSLFYFGKFVLGYDLEVEPHLAFCDFVQEETRPKILTLMPRGSFKTTVVSQIYPLWLAIRNPNVRILLYSESLKNSMRNLEVIQQTIQKNARFRHLYGELAGKDDGNQYALFIKTRTNWRLKEPTFGTGSLETVDNGQHWDYILCDDLHSEKNTTSKEQIESVYLAWKLLFSLLDPGKYMRMVGTRWSDQDVYGIIKESHKAFEVYERPAELPDGNLLFPKRLTREALAAIRGEQGDDIYFSQYMNDPLPKGDSQAFRKQDFQYGEHRDCPLVMAVDPAISQSDRADFSAIVLGGWSDKNELFVEHEEHGRMDPFKLIDRMIALLQHYGTRIRTIATEDVAFQRMLRYALERRLKELSIHVNVIGLKHTLKKEARILGLQPLYRAKAVYHKLALKGGELEEELQRFPRGRRDDVIDALASIVEVSQPRTKAYAKAQEKRYAQERVDAKRKRMEHESKGSLDAMIQFALASKRNGWERKDPPPIVPGGSL